MPDIGLAIHRISEWYKVNVPSKELILNLGADDDAIQQFETELSLQLPSEVKEMYKLMTEAVSVASFLTAITCPPWSRFGRIANVGGTAWRKVCSME